VDLDFLRIVAQAVPRPEWLLGAFLLWLRISAMFLLTPLLHTFAVPPTVRVLFTLCLALALAAGLSVEVPLDVSTGALIAASAAELALGAAMALAVLTAFAAISMAGRMLDVQVGYGMAQVFDPTTQRQTTPLAAGFDRLAVVFFFVLDGPHALLRGIAFSLERFPLGRPWSPSAAAGPLLQHVAGLFGLAFSLALPVLACLLLVELGLGVLARNLPQMNLFVVGAPVKIGVGLAALALWTAGASEAMGRIYASIYRTWDAVLTAHPAPQGSR
jgi:flagellar biosynthetic protein FliR